MFKEFKEFALKGNVIDMAIGIIIGSSFGKIITSLVNDILMPPIGLMVGNVDFSNLTITLKEKTATSAAVVVKYGLFINTIIDFVIVAFAIFFMIRQIGRLAKFHQKPAAPAEATTKACPFCLSQIAIKATRCPACTSAV